MSELREKITEVVRLLVESDILPPDEAIKQILAAFKAHIEGCEKPENPHPSYLAKYPSDDLTTSELLSKGMRLGFQAAIEDFRKALVESLKEEKGAK